MKFTPRDAFSKDNWIIDSESILQVLLDILTEGDMDMYELDNERYSWICKKNPLVKAENDLFDATHL